MLKTNLGLIEYCRAQLGRPYWMGTFGQLAGAGLYGYNKMRLPGDYLWADMPSQFGLRVHDCIGLVKGYLWSDGPDGLPEYLADPCPLDHSADSMLAACAEHGPIATLPELAGVLVFRPGHVGVYAGDGKVLEARGHRYGVVETQLVERDFKNWGICPYIFYEEDDMTQDKFNEMAELWLENRNSLPEPEWSQKEGAWKKAAAVGIVNGNAPEGYLKRDEMTAILDRMRLIE